MHSSLPLSDSIYCFSSFPRFTLLRLPPQRMKERLTLFPHRLVQLCNFLSSFLFRSQLVKWAAGFNDLMSKLNVEMSRLQSRAPCPPKGSYCAAKSALDGKLNESMFTPSRELIQSLLHVTVS